MLDQDQVATLQDYVDSNPDSIPEFAGAWPGVDDPTVQKIMNNEGQVPGQTLNREFVSTLEVWGAIQQTRPSANPPYDDYETRSHLLKVCEVTGVPLDDKAYPDVDAKVKWIFEGASDTLQKLTEFRTRPATPAEHLFGIEGIAVLNEDVRNARRLDTALRQA